MPAGQVNKFKRRTALIQYWTQRTNSNCT